MTNEEWKQLLGDWKTRVAVYQEGLYNTARDLEKRHYRLGVPAVVFAAIAGTTAFTNLSKDTFSFEARLTVVIVSVLAAALTAVQTFMNYGQRGEKARAVSNQLGGVRKRIDILEKFQPESPDKAREVLEGLNNEITAISKDAPLLAATEIASSKAPATSGRGRGSVMIKKM